MARSEWGSKIGFILAASGSAVGLGAIWKFPYVAGQNGGGAFLLVYLAITFSIGIAMLLAEMVIGRAAGLSAVGAFRTLAGPAWAWVGRMGLLCIFTIFSFYSVIGGWTLMYIGEALSGAALAKDTAFLGQHFTALISDPVNSIAYLIAFVGLTAAIVVGGVQKGIESVSKVLMPLLFVLMLVLIARALTLPGAMEGVMWFVTPDWSKVNDSMFIDALGLACFSLSVGCGTMIAYGSYLGRDIQLGNAAVWVAALAVVACLLAGLMVLPAVFAFGMDPAAGPGLTFITMPAVFASMPGGQFFAVAFFCLLLVAALTSSISMLEPIVSFLIDEFHWSRKTAVIVSLCAVILAAIPAALSFGVWSDAKLFNRTTFELMDYLASNLLLPLGGMASAICVGWVIWQRSSAEITQQGARAAWLPVFRLTSAVVAPALIAWVFVKGL
ncbi:sodium-dependent transporter [Deefgea piscis]|uniref:sodium-dependent transporter n=1 Tax=Deefgea piscis TaxID=2739061 RepID=UPI001C7F59FE|nr:sodium-dependent transporter [Deefgea piscis]QZA80043.1 sodium-dependent transporter [Deefgea piscis]